MKVKTKQEDIVMAEESPLFHRFDFSEEYEKHFDCVCCLMKVKAKHLMQAYCCCSSSSCH